MLHKFCGREVFWLLRVARVNDWYLFQMLSLHRFYRNVGLCVFKRNFSAPVAPFASRVTPEDGKAQETQVTENANADRGKQIARTNASQAAKSKLSQVFFFFV